MQELGYKKIAWRVYYTSLIKPRGESPHFTWWNYYYQDDESIMIFIF